MAQALGQAKLMMVLLGVFAGGRAAARDGRHLRRGRLHGRATHRRDRSAHGARRANDGCSAAGREAGNEAGDLRIGRRIRRRARARPLDRVAALSNSAHNPLLLERDHRRSSVSLRCSRVCFPRAGPVCSIQWKRCEQSNPRLGSTRLRVPMRPASGLSRQIVAARRRTNTRDAFAPRIRPCATS